MKRSFGTTFQFVMDVVLIRPFKYAVFILALLNYGHSFGVCIDDKGNSGRHPSVKEEFNNSIAVAIAEAEQFKNVNEDLSDPQGVTATIYRVHITKLIRGHLAKRIDVRSENDSGRFPMDLKKRYLLFLHKEKQAYYVDNCGNSGLLSQRANVLQELGLSQEDIK